jgi:RNA:NAD 2'-phosphotransferase (TPT1/KptA family)
VATSDKGRFQLETTDEVVRIRAVQGHSLRGVQPTELMTLLHLNDPGLPRTVVHATYMRLAHVILQEGLKAGGERGSAHRTHVHFAPSAWSLTLGADLVTVGSVVSSTDFTRDYFDTPRHDCEIAVWVDLGAAMRENVPFFKAENGVFCSPGIDGLVPPHYIERISHIDTGRVAWSRQVPASAPATPVRQSNGPAIEGGDTLRSDTQRASEVASVRVDLSRLERQPTVSAATGSGAEASSEVGAVPTYRGLGRWYHVELDRAECSTIGCKVKHFPGGFGVLEILMVKEEEGGALHDWNMQCLTTFPDDVVKPGDQIMQANGVSHNPDKMLGVLKSFIQGVSGELFLVMHRPDP